MRQLFTTQAALAAGTTMDALRWGVRAGRHRRVLRGVYAQGPEEPTTLDLARARILARPGSVARGHLAGVLHGLEGVRLDAGGVRRGLVPVDRIVTIDGVACADGSWTLADLAGTLDDIRWEQALESGLRKRLATVPSVEHDARGRPGAPRIRRVLAMRPPNTPPTESLLETLMVQLARHVRALPEATRQLVVRDEYDHFIARVDLAWPEPGVFAELDGEHHKGQPVYDSRRQTAVQAATGWLVGRFTWTEVVDFPRSTARRLEALALRARGVARR